MKKIKLVLFLLSIPFVTFSQSYDLAAGMRLGTEWGFTGKYRFANRASAELIIQSSVVREEMMLTALAEQHFPLVSKRFNFYSGGGFHKGWLQDSPEIQLKNPFGLTFIVGGEATLGRMNVSYDFKPAVNLSGGEQRVYFQSGVSLRYVIDQRKWKEDRERNKAKRQKNRKKKRKKKDKEAFNWKFWKKDQ